MRPVVISTQAACIKCTVITTASEIYSLFLHCRILQIVFCSTEPSTEHDLPCSLHATYTSYIP